VALVGRSGLRKIHFAESRRGHGFSDFRQSAVWIVSRLLPLDDGQTDSIAPRERSASFFSRFNCSTRFTVFENVETSHCSSLEKSSPPRKRQREPARLRVELNSRGLASAIPPISSPAARCSAWPFARALHPFIHQVFSSGPTKPTGNLDTTTGNVILELLRASDARNTKPPATIYGRPIVSKARIAREHGREVA